MSPTLTRWLPLQPEPGEALHSPPDVLRDGWEQPLGRDIRRSGKEPQGAVGMKPPRQDGIRSHAGSGGTGIRAELPPTVFPGQGFPGH